MVPSCILEVGLTFLPLLKCYIQRWKLGNKQSEADPKFNWLAATPMLMSKLRIVLFFCSFCSQRWFSPEKKWTSFITLLPCTTTWKLQQRLSIFLPYKTSSSKWKLEKMLQFVRLLVLWIQTLYSLDLVLEIICGISKLISDKLENS